MEEDYKKMDLLKPIIYIPKYWICILIFTIISTGITYYVTTEVINNRYSAYTTLYIGKEGDGDVEINLFDVQVNNQLVIDYQQLIKTNIIIEQVIKDLQISMSLIDFKEHLSVATIGESRFINIFFEDHNPEFAAEVADELSKVLVMKAVDIVGVQNIHIVDYAKVPEKPIFPNVLMSSVIGGICGLVLSVFIVTLRIMRHNTIQDENEIEEGFGLMLMGVIPSTKGRACL